MYSLIKVPRSVSNTDIPEASRALFSYRERGGSVPYDPYLDAIFPGITPKPSEWKSERISKYTDKDGNPIAENVGELNGRKFALERSEQEKLLTMLADPDVCDYLTLQDLHMQNKRMTVVFNRKKTRVFFLEISYDIGSSYCMKSKIYGSYDRAMFDFQHKRISWFECLPLTSLSLVLPRRG